MNAPIHIAGMDMIVRKQRSALRAFGLSPDDDNTNNRPTIDGLIAPKNKRFMHRGRERMFGDDCFLKSLKSGKRVVFCLEHNTSDPLASNRDALYLVENPDGLACRIDLSKVKNSAMLKRIVEIGDRKGFSVGCTIVKSEDRKFGNQIVNVILEATVDEISLVRNPALEDAFAYIADAERTPAPSAGNRSNDYAIESATHRANVATKKMSKRNMEMTARLDAIDKRMGIDSRPDPVAGFTAACDKLLRTLKAIRV